MQLKFNPNKGKNLKFEFKVEGIEEALTARLILRTKDGSSLMFESIVGSKGEVDIKIPALKDYKDIKSNAVLEVVSESQRFIPWTGDVEFEIEPVVKMESVTEEDVAKPAVKMESMKESELIDENRIVKTEVAPHKKKPLVSFL